MTPAIAGAGRLRLPKPGLGTWPMTGEACRDAVPGAPSLGYRHIDTAERYENEDAVGAVLGGCGIPRAEIHVTTKVWWGHLQPDAMRDAMARSLDALRTDCVDFYLIHWPAPDWDQP